MVFKFTIPIIIKLMLLNYTSKYLWGIIPFGQGLAISDFSLGILYTFALSSLGVYGVLLAGWSANSKYAFLGSL